MESSAVAVAWPFKHLKCMFEALWLKTKQFSSTETLKQPTVEHRHFSFTHARGASDEGAEMVLRETTKSSACTRYRRLVKNRHSTATSTSSLFHFKFTGSAPILISNHRSKFSVWNFCFSKTIHETGSVFNGETVASNDGLITFFGISVSGF
jgi:hypothetical protein